ncbi:uncharacterized protein FYW47_010299 [Aplochiton taeniatus]
MPAKTPMYLKTTTPKRGKRLKLRDFLSGDMISPPMGEVRHSAHVGPQGEGDMFGDVGFLQGNMDMLPALRGSNGRRSQSMEGHLEGESSGPKGSLSYSYNNNQHLLKSTVSMPVFLSHEQAPPKPPRLHLDDPPLAPPPSQSQCQSQSQPSQLSQQNHTGPGRSAHGRANGQTQQRPFSLWDSGVTSDLPSSTSVRHLVPSSGSFSEASSEDSMSECCGPLDPRRGLSLDSDAGLSNEDLRSDSPGAPPPTGSLAPGTAASRGPASGAGVARSESLAGLDLDLGPSILDDVLGIMDRYKTVEDRWEL